MGASRLRRYGLALAVAAGVFRSAGAGAGTTPNLLVNGDAELQSCTKDWTAQTSIPGWRVVRGAASVLCYSAFKFTGQTLITPPHKPGGKALFGAPGADTEMEQIVDVAAAGAGIDKGRVRFDLAGWLGGWSNRPERATLTAVFLGADGTAIGRPVVITNAGAQARHGETRLLERRAEGLVPPGTRRIAITVQFLSGLESFHNAYADNLSLKLKGPVDGLAPGTAMPPASNIPALDHVYVLMMENTNYADVFHTDGSGVVTVDPHMPYFAALAKSGVILANMWAVYHPSDQNYVAMTGGNTFRFGPVYYPHYHLGVTHLGDLLDAMGKSWRGYAQDMDTPCSLHSHGKGRESFSPDDEPFVQFADVIDNQARCDADLRDLGDFETAVGNNTLPDFAWLAADNWWDGEGAWYEKYNVGFSNAKQDRFIRSTLKPLIESAQWKNSKSLLIITWDEADGWAWPDDHVPTLLMGSPGLLRAGTVLYEHVDHYDLLRTIESALGTGGLGRFDTFARPVNAAFAQGNLLEPRNAGGLLWPAGALATRGSIVDTFGRASVPAAVYQGEPITLTVPDGVDGNAGVNLEPLGQVPTANSKIYRFNGNAVEIPTTDLAPGFYGAWLRQGKTPPSLAPMMVTILAPALITPDQPGVEIVGGAESGGNTAEVSLREGSNPILRYCLPSGVAPDAGWIGVFPAGTPPKHMTKHDANSIGFWLKTPGGGPGEPECGEAEAYASELKPRRNYEVLLFQDGAEALPVGRTAMFTVTPSLPR
ncbi:MAG TPA: alkaline phosphatase family protein [Rhizomicrobium sp.]|nr:alkaline phosphatase family protein [Rhizomicrobium sp.]